jgi:hypothetical protein
MEITLGKELFNVALQSRQVLGTKSRRQIDTYQVTTGEVLRGSSMRLSVLHRESSYDLTDDVDQTVKKIMRSAASYNIQTLYRVPTLTQFNLNTIKVNLIS